MKNFEFAIATGPNFSTTLEHLKRSIKNNAEMVKRNLTITGVFAIPEMVVPNTFEKPVPAITVVLLLTEDVELLPKEYDLSQEVVAAVIAQG